MPQTTRSQTPKGLVDRELYVLAERLTEPDRMRAAGFARKVLGKVTELPADLGSAGSPLRQTNSLGVYGGWG